VLNNAGKEQRRGLGAKKTTGRRGQTGGMRITFGRLLWHKSSLAKQKARGLAARERESEKQGLRMMDSKRKLLRENSLRCINKGSAGYQREEKEMPERSGEPEQGRRGVIEVGKGNKSGQRANAGGSWRAEGKGRVTGKGVGRRGGGSTFLKAQRYFGANVRQRMAPDETSC